MSKILYVDFDPESAAGQMKLSGIRRRLSFGGMDVVLLPMSMSRPKELAAALARHRPAGCIVECSHGHVDLPPTLFGDLPVVYLDGRSSLYGGRVSKVVHDGTATARAAFKELLKTRPSCLAVVGWSERVFWSSLREKTFVACSREAHVPCRLFRCVGDGNDRGSRLVGWLSRLPSNCGVFATNDQVAQEVLSACVMAGRSVPGDLKVLGVDNVLSVCETCSPTLSSIQIDFEMAGYRAADLLLRRMVGEGRERRRATFGPMLTMHRTSTGGSRHADRTVLKAIEIIRNGACLGLRAADLARRIGCSRRLIELRFRESVGHSILDEIQSVRLERVIGLLRNPSVPLEAIPGQAGFPSAAALRKAFRLRLGCSLREWRGRNLD